MSSAFTCAMPKSLLLSQLRPRKAPVLGPGRELRQLTPRLSAGARGGLFSSGGWDFRLFSCPFPTLLPKKTRLKRCLQPGAGEERTITPGHGPSCSFPCAGRIGGQRNSNDAVMGTREPGVHQTSPGPAGWSPVNRAGSRCHRHLLPEPLRHHQRVWEPQGCREEAATGCVGQKKL